MPRLFLARISKKGRNPGVIPVQSEKKGFPGPSPAEHAILLPQGAETRSAPGLPGPNFILF
jgi:hypothetical protein